MHWQLSTEVTGSAVSPVIHVFQPVQQLLEERTEGSKPCAGFASMKPSSIHLPNQWIKVLGIWTHHLHWRRSKSIMRTPSLAPCPSSSCSPLPTFRQQHSALLALLHSHLCVGALSFSKEKIFFLPIQYLLTINTNKWPPLAKLRLLVCFHFALLHTRGMG